MRAADNQSVISPEHSPLVMLVDGTAEADAIAAAIEGAGLRLVRAGDTRSAETLFVTVRPGLIILSLDDEGALAFCDLIGAIPRGSGVPVLLLGGEGEEGAACREAVEASIWGPHATLPRPVQVDELLERLRDLLGLEAAASTSLSQVPAAEIDEPTLGITREPTQVLGENASPVGDLLHDPAFGLGFADILKGSDLDLGLGGEAQGTASHPWEVRLEALGSDDAGGSAGSGESTAEPGTSATAERIDTRLVTTERPGLVGALPEIPAPWSPAGEPEPGPAPVDRSDALPHAPPQAQPDDDGPSGVTELSADFRRVIDEVAQRLFPESPPDEYQDDHLDEIQTIVPVVDHGLGLDDDVDFYAQALDGMETFSVGPPGLTLSILDGLQTEERLRRTPAADSEGGRTSIRDVAALEDGPTGASPAVSGPAPQGQEAAEPARAEPAPARRDPIPILVGTEQISYGDLAEHPVPELLAACIRGRLSGQLVVRQRPQGAADATEPGASLPVRTIVFDAGRPLAATSGQVQDRMVELLLRQGTLNDEQAARCRALVEATGRRPGAILVELGAIKTAELFPLVRWHFRELLVACFDWRSGSFWVETGPPPSQWRIRLEEPGAALLLEGLRRRYAADELVALLGGEGARLRRIGTAPIEGVLDEERDLLDLCDGTRTLARVLEETGVERGQALAVLQGLALLGVLAREPPGAAAEPARDVAVDRARLEQRIRLCQEADYFTLLGVSPEASTYEIRKAHEQIAHELSPGRLAAIDTTDLDARLADVRYVIDEALEVLTDPALREAYRQSRF